MPSRQFAAQILEKHSKKSLSFTSILQIPENNEDIAHNHYKITQYTD